MTSKPSLHPAWVAGGIFLLVSLWLLSGVFSAGEAKIQIGQSAVEAPRMRVRVMDSLARELTREAQVSGRTAPLREVTLRAQASGRLLEIAAQRGQRLQQGELIARLESGDRPARLAQAEAQVDKRVLEFEAAQKLHRQGVISPLELSAARSNLLQARAERDQAETALSHVELRAPFDGVLESRALEIGHYVNTGDEFGRFIQNQPFLVKAQVPEDVVVYLRQGQSARALLPDGREVDGILRYVASQADAATRTFPLELEVRGLAKPVIAGGSAVLMLPLELVRVHVVEPAALALSDAGEFGIKAVNDRGEVEFHRGEIAQAGQREIWLSGLPEQLRVITVGQGFVSQGDRVEAVISAAGEPEA